MRGLRTDEAGSAGSQWIVGSWTSLCGRPENKEGPQVDGDCEGLCDGHGSECGVFVIRWEFNGCLAGKETAMPVVLHALGAD